MRSPDSFRYAGGNPYELTAEHAQELGGQPVRHRAQTPDELERALRDAPPTLVIGQCEEPQQLVDLLVRYGPAPIQHLFLGDILQHEFEISWIKQPDLSRLFGALPQLETLRIRGCYGLAFGAIQHDRLRTLIVESGGLPAQIAIDLGKSELPALEHLELWLGRREYGGTIATEDVEPLLDPARFPRLDHIALRNAEIADQIAPAVLQSPLAPQLTGLDLSLGILTDSVAKAILGIASARSIASIDVSVHYFTPALVERLRGLGNIVGLEHASDRHEDGLRYTAIGE